MSKIVDDFYMSKVLIGIDNSACWNSCTQIFKLRSSSSFGMHSWEMNELWSWSIASDWLLSSHDYLDTLFTSGLLIITESSSYLLWSMTCIKSMLSVATDLIELRFYKVLLRELVIFDTLCSSISSLSRMTSKQEQLELHSSKNFCLRRQ